MTEISLWLVNTMPRPPRPIVIRRTYWPTRIPFVILRISFDKSATSQKRNLYTKSLWKLYRSNLDTKLLDLANTVRPYALLNEEQGNLDSARKLWEEARHLYGSLRVEAGVSECDDHISQLKRC